MSIGLFLAATIAVIVLMTAGLRAVSRRHSTACPVWLTVLLENPYFEAVAGSETLLERARVEPGMKVLDVGCGPGRVTLPAAREVGPGGSVLALDVQAGMLHKLEARMRQAGVTNVRTLVADIGEGRLSRDAFDRALLVTVLGEIVHREAALKEIHDSLRSGGMLSVTEALPDPHYQSRRNVRRRVEAAGFDFTEQFGTWWAFTMNFTKR